jgi:protein tyrosine kinase modulator
MIPGKKYTLADFLRIAWRRKWIIVTPLLVLSIGTYLAVKRLPNRYKSQTTILVVPQRVPDSYVRSTVTAPIVDRLRSISEQILSRSRLERVIQEYELYPIERRRLPMEDVVEKMRDDISVDTVKVDSFSVSYTCGDAVVAKRITERLASMFIDENMRDRVVLADGTSQFLESQLDDARRRLIEHEKKLESYRERYAGELPTQLESNLQVIQNAEGRVQALGESINRDRDRKLLQERLLADLQAADPAGVAAPTIAAAASSTIEQLQTARSALADLELRLKPEHPDLARAKRTVAELERKLASESAQRRAPSDVPLSRLSPAEIAQRNRTRELTLEIQNLDHQIGEKQAEQQRLSGVIATYQRRVAAVPTHESELTELMRDYETLQKAYTSLLSRKEESRTAADLERRQIGEQFKILDPARLPERPSSPNRRQLQLVGIGLAIGLGVALAGLIEYLDKTLKSEMDVRAALNLVVLAGIPILPEVRRRGDRRWKVVAISAAVLLVAAAGTAAVVWKVWR